jgi:NarL family two-component system response regulator YdfI
MIRVFITSRSPLVRAGLEAVLAERAGIVIMGSAARAAADVLAAANPDVLVLDAGTAEEHRVELPLLPTVLLLADEADRAPTLAEMDDGVRAVLPIGASGDELAAAIHAAAAGLVALTASAAASLVHSMTPRLDATGIEALTPREAEVLRWMVDGLGNKSIAVRLGISEHTVKAHVAAILSKLDASTRTEAVAIGLRSGLVVL